MEAEESLFRMFAAIDLSRLPVQAALSPWVPPQVWSMTITYLYTLQTYLYAFNTTVISLHSH